MRLTDGDSPERFPELLAGGGHRGRVEGARDREQLGLYAGRTGFLSERLEPVALTGEHDLVGRVVVRHGQSEAACQRGAHLAVHAQCEHAALAGGFLGRALHQPPAQCDEPEPTRLVDSARRRERGQLAQRLAHEHVHALRGQERPAGRPAQ